MLGPGVNPSPLKFLQSLKKKPHKTVFPTFELKPITELNATKPLLLANILGLCGRVLLATSRSAPSQIYHHVGSVPAANLPHAGRKS